MPKSQISMAIQMGSGEVYFPRKRSTKSSLERRVACDSRSHHSACAVRPVRGLSFLAKFPCSSAGFR